MPEEIKPVLSDDFIYERLHYYEGIKADLFIGIQQHLEAYPIGYRDIKTAYLDDYGVFVTVTYELQERRVTRIEFEYVIRNGMQVEGLRGTFANPEDTVMVAIDPDTRKQL